MWPDLKRRREKSMKSATQKLELCASIKSNFVLLWKTLTKNYLMSSVLISFSYSCLSAYNLQNDFFFHVRTLLDERNVRCATFVLHFNGTTSTYRIIVKLFKLRKKNYWFSPWISTCWVHSLICGRKRKII